MLRLLGQGFDFWGKPSAPPKGVVDYIEMSDVAAFLAADVVAFLAADTTDVLPGPAPWAHALSAYLRVVASRCSGRLKVLRDLLHCGLGCSAADGKYQDHRKGRIGTPYHDRHNRYKRSNSDNMHGPTA